MVYSFTWNTQPKGNDKTTKAVASQYIKAKYGTSLEEFAKMIILEEAQQEKQAAEKTDSLHIKIM